MAETLRSAVSRRLMSMLAAPLLGLCGCTDTTKIHEAELTRLLAVLPGNYDNSAQAELETRNGVRPAHDAVALTITHVQAPWLGHHVYYAQETAADDARRVLSQEVFSFQVDEKRGIVETIYQLTEPLRWRDGQLHKELFSSIMKTDVQEEGCQLLWKAKDAGFVAAHDPKVCPDTGGGAAAPQARLSAGLLSIGDYSFRKSR